MGFFILRAERVNKKKNIKITIIDRLGAKGCHRGMRIGKSYDWESQRGQLCPMVCHIAFPYVDILRYGGNFGGDTPYETTFCCSDPKTIMVYKIELVDETTDEICSVMV